MRYIIIGAGAVGGTIGGCLALAGHDVVLTARGAHLDALRGHGLRLRTPAGPDTVPVTAIGGPGEADLRPGDVLVVATKSQDSVAALSEWASRPVAGGGTAGQRLAVICAQNGVANERFALRRFRHVYGMGVWLPASHVAPGEVVAHGWPLADLDGDPSAAARELRERTTAEGTAVLDAAGIGYASPAEVHAARGRHVNFAPVPGVAYGGGSSWQSLTRGTGSIEADFLNGEVVLLSRERGIPAPVNEALQRLANRAAADRLAPGSLTPQEILAAARER